MVIKLYICHVSVSTAGSYGHYMPKMNCNHSLLLLKKLLLLAKAYLELQLFPKDISCSLINHAPALLGMSYKNVYVPDAVCI